MESICLCACGNQFIKTNPNHINCSKECAKENSKRTVYNKSCIFCGDSYQTVAKNQKFCSSSCTAKNANKSIYLFDSDGQKTHKKCTKCNQFEPLINFRRKADGELLRSMCVPCERDHENTTRDKKRRREASRKYVIKKVWMGKCSKIYINKCSITGDIFVSRYNTNKSPKGILLEKETILKKQLDRISKRNAIADKRQEKITCKCLECGNEFEARKYTKSGKLVEMIPPNYCSKSCNKTARNRTSRVKDRAKRKLVKLKTVNPLLVFENYNWHCANCKRETPRHLRGTYKNNAPELDHIFPLSKGGDHSYENTQLLCRKCNSEKKDKIITTQFKIPYYATTGIRTNGLLIQAGEKNLFNNSQAH